MNISDITFLCYVNFMMQRYAFCFNPPNVYQKKY